MGKLNEADLREGISSLASQEKPPKDVIATLQQAVDAVYLTPDIMGDWVNKPLSTLISYVKGNINGQMAIAQLTQK
jgi:hypothetical protein